LFDIDGTLIRTGGAGRRAFEAAIEAVAGVSRALDNYSLAGRTDSLIIEHALSQSDRTQPDDVRERVFADYLTRLEHNVAASDGYEVLPGVPELLERLESMERHALGIGTGNIEAGARIKLARGDLNRFFPCGGFGSDAEDRAGLLRAGRSKAEAHWGVTFAEIWVIGDTIMDVNAAHAIGAKAVAAATGGTSASELAVSQPEILVEDLTDLAALELLLQ
jgi:phosphoglycolate phosphatase-like HAD superfamily hydrolase